MIESGIGVRIVDSILFGFEYPLVFVEGGRRIKIPYLFVEEFWGNE